MKVSEKRTQIYLRLDMFKALEQESRQEKKSIAEIIRQAVQSHLEERQSRRLRELDWQNDPLTKIAGMVHDGPADLSANHDHYLYGWDKKT